MDISLYPDFPSQIYHIALEAVIEHLRHKVRHKYFCLFVDSYVLLFLGLYTSTATHFHVSIPPSHSSESIMLRPTPIHTLPVPFSATQGMEIKTD